MSLVTITRRYWSSLPSIEVEIGAEYDNSSTSIRLGAAVKIFVRKEAAEGRRANLREADLSAADLRAADLRAANLSEANLREADLSAADLSAADLSEADLRAANLSEADLSAADLREADLRAANLSEADLREADLSAADLSAADLSEADLSAAKNLPEAALRAIRSDFWDVLLTAIPEVPALLDALRAGKVDGSTYSGDCACLVGTIANVREVDYSTLGPDSYRPIERWFMGIKKGDTPETNPVAKVVEGWILQFQAAIGQPATFDEVAALARETSK